MATACEPVIQAPLFKLPSLIISNTLCTYIEAEDLLEFGSTCSSLFEACEKSVAWENICRSEHIAGEKDKITNWRLHYLIHRSKYFYMMNTRDPKFVNIFKPFREIRVVLWGPGGVGKSSAIISFMVKRFVSDYDPTIEDNYRKEIECANKAIILDIFEPGSWTDDFNDFQAVANHYLLIGNVFVILFDITNRTTFNKIPEYHQRIVRAKQSQDIDPALQKLCNRPPCAILVGAKFDLEEKRQVTTEEGKEMAVSLHTKYMEISSKANINVNALFEEVVWMFARDVYYEDVAENEEKKQQQENTSMRKTKKCIVM